jgi:hypothetical protein
VESTRFGKKFDRLSIPFNSCRGDAAARRRLAHSADSLTNDGNIATFLDVVP